MSMRAPVRWKEWIPLATQQQRLRNLIQVMAYNMQHERLIENDMIESFSYYYTLHSNTMSSPFYMSEKLESEHPKWMEVDFSKEHGTLTGVIIRLWRHSARRPQDQVLSVSGIYFSGLVYIGPRLLQTDPTLYKGNTIIFHMHGGYFTCPAHFRSEQPEVARNMSISLGAKQVRTSYTINMLSKLHSLQQEMKRESGACEGLRARIAAGGSQERPPGGRSSSAALRKLLSRTKPKPPAEAILGVKKRIEEARARVQLLRTEKQRIEKQVKLRHGACESEKELIDDLGCDLMNKYRSLNKDMIRLKERRRQNEERKQLAINVCAQLSHRRRQLISDLNDIFPIVQVSSERYEICGVFLPNSEHLGYSTSDTASAVALGLVVALIQAVSTFLSLPLRYPVLQLSSRSKVIDPITVDIPDSEREFALFPRGSSYKHQFLYGVYLINKNIAQLRQDCGLSYSDPRNTLANLYSLLNHKESLAVQNSRHRTLSGSTLDPSSLQSSPLPPSLQSSPLHKAMSAPIMIRDKAPPQSCSNSVDSAVYESSVTPDSQGTVRYESSVTPHSQGNVLFKYGVTPETQDNTRYESSVTQHSQDSALYESSVTPDSQERVLS